jgi:hypothetical protein
MTENEMKLDEPATRRDLKDLRTELENHPTRRDLRDALANHPTHAQLDASLRQVMLHIEATVARHANAILEAVRDMVRGLDDQYRDLPARVTKLEAAVFSPPPKRKRKAG